MATIGGNLLQRTRCRYFRDPAVAACNKRAPGAGCAAVAGAARMHAILGASEHCIALHASDLCVALVALDAIGARPGRPRAARPPADGVLRAARRAAGRRERRSTHGELITAIDVPLLPPVARSRYLKVRDRASYEFALVSVAAALVIDDGIVVDARLGTRRGRHDPVAGPRGRGGPARRAVPSRARSRPRRSAAISDPFTVEGTAFKVPLAERAIIRMLEDLSRMTSTARRVIGAPVDRVDGKLKVAGAAPYPSDVSYPGMAYAAFVRSTIAAGRILDIDAADAVALPGRARVITHRNAPRLGRAAPSVLGPQPPPPLQDDRVLHYGQYVAVVVADTPQQAADAARRVVVTYEPGEALLAIDDDARSSCDDPFGLRHAPRRRRRPGLRPPTSSTTPSTRPRRTRTTRSGCSRPSPRGTATRSSCTTPRSSPSNVRTVVAGAFGDPGVRGACAHAVSRRRLRRRAASLAARRPRRARGTGGGPAGQGHARPDRRCSPASATAHARCSGSGSAPSATASSSRWSTTSLQTVAMEDDNRDFVSLTTYRFVRLPEHVRARPAAAAEHPVPGVDAGAGRGAGQLRAGVGDRRALVRARHRPAASCGCATTRRSHPAARTAVVEQGAAGVLRGRRRSASAGPTATRESASMRDGRWRVG